MRVLVVTNDFPPTVGGIQSYVRDFLATLPADDVVVFASTQDAVAASEWDERAPYKVIRWPQRIMLPTRGVSRRMSQIIAEERIDTVWFGAAAPLALLAPAARNAGAYRVVASTHGHEVGWSMLPVARQALRFIGRHCDAISYISRYTHRRLRRSFGPTTTWVRLPSGVDATAYRRPSDLDIRTQLSLGPGPIVACISRLVPRKGQDTLLAVWPKIVAAFPEAQLVLAGEGPYEKSLRKQAEGVSGVSIVGRISDPQRTALLQQCDIFAMPARTRGWGLDVEGLGIVYLEAQAAGVPVIAGDSGGAPETITSDSGVVVAGGDSDALEQALLQLLADPERRKRMGAAGQRFVVEKWNWERLGREFRRLLHGGNLGDILER